METKRDYQARIRASIVSPMATIRDVPPLTTSTELDLPEYEDYETLRKQVYLAMTAGSEYFGFA